MSDEFYIDYTSSSMDLVVILMMTDIVGLDVYEWCRGETHTEPRPV